MLSLGLVELIVLAVFISGVLLLVGLATALLLKGSCQNRPLRR
jgi:hypothetical protein